MQPALLVERVFVSLYIFSQQNSRYLLRIYKVCYGDLPIYYFLTHFPKIDTNKANLVWEKYNPNFPYIDPHIAISFPVDSPRGTENLIIHMVWSSASDRILDALEYSQESMPEVGILAT